MTGKDIFLFNSNIGGYALPNYGETETEIEGQRGTRTKKGRDIEPNIWQGKRHFFFKLKYKRIRLA